MAQPKRYNATVPRPYRDSRGNEKTHFWQVGTAFPMKEGGGVAVKLYSKMLLTDTILLFPIEEEDEQAPKQEDDLPF